jgi:phosphoribosylamine-glycine ligase
LTSHRFVGEGIVPLEDSWFALQQWCREAPSILLFDSSGLGELADSARRAGIITIGGGKFCDKLEKDRSFGRRLAEQVGIESPPCMEFASIDACLAYAPELKRPVYWKTDAYISGDATHKCENAEELTEYLLWIKTQTRSDIHCILEDALPGFALSTARWWNGRAWVGPYEWTLERKAFMNDDVGPSTGASVNAVGMYEEDEPLMAKALNFAKLAEPFAAHEAPPGLYDINAVVLEGKAYFLEWTPRFGWDSEGTSHLLYPNFSEWLLCMTLGTPAYEPVRDVFAMATRVTVAPAPWEHGERDEKGSAVDMYVRGPVGNLWANGFVGYELYINEVGLAVAAPEGLVGLATAVGNEAGSMGEQINALAGELRCSSRPQYRTDIAKAMNEDVEKCYDAGFDDLPSGLGV